MSNIDQANDLVGLEIGDFQPCAYFDKHMDCIRVFTHDRSITEIRMDEVVTLHMNNARQGDMDPDYVGFTIKGVNHLFNLVGLEQAGVIRLAHIIDKLVKFRPNSSVSAVMKMVFERHASVGEASVDFRQAA